MEKKYSKSEQLRFSVSIQPVQAVCVLPGLFMDMQTDYHLKNAVCLVLFLQAMLSKSSVQGWMKTDGKRSWKFLRKKFNNHTSRLHSGPGHKEFICPKGFVKLKCHAIVQPCKYMTICRGC